VQNRVSRNDSQQVAKAISRSEAATSSEGVIMTKTRAFKEARADSIPEEISKGSMMLLKDAVLLESVPCCKL